MKANMNYPDLEMTITFSFEEICALQDISDYEIQGPEIAEWILEHLLIDADRFEQHYGSIAWDAMRKHNGVELYD